MGIISEGTFLGRLKNLEVESESVSFVLARLGPGLPVTDGLRWGWMVLILWLAVSVVLLRDIGV